MSNLILNSLEIRNFRIFQDLKIDHLGQVNLLVGKNNIGKTSLLEAIQSHAKEIPSILISAHGLSKQHLTELWDNIALTQLKDEILTALRLLAPGVIDLDFIHTPHAGKDRIPILQIAHNDEPLPLYSLGNGMLRVLGISLALVNLKNGILLIDEFENGLYYSVQPDLWQFIFQVACRLNA